jgi:hypothetical protein
MSGISKNNEIEIPLIGVSKMVDGIETFFVSVNFTSLDLISTELSVSNFEILSLLDGTLKSYDDFFGGAFGS